MAYDVSPTGPSYLQSVQAGNFEFRAPGPWSISGLVFLRSLANTPTLLAQGASIFGFEFRVSNNSDGKLAVQMTWSGPTTQTYAATTQSVFTDRWLQVGVTVNDTDDEVHFYTDGKLVEVVSMGVTPGFSWGTSAFFVGTNVGAASTDTVDGKIANIGWWDRVLSPLEMRRLGDFVDCRVFPHQLRHAWRLDGLRDVARLSDWTDSRRDMTLVNNARPVEGAIRNVAQRIPTINHAEEVNVDIRQQTPTGWPT